MCPTCGKPWYMVNARTGGMMVLTDKGIKPHEPTIPAAPDGPEKQSAVSPELPLEMRGTTPDFTDTKKRTPEKTKRTR